jgi:hypothetical protein
MNKEIRVHGIARKQLDHEKLAYAFLLLARSLRQQDGPDNPDAAAREVS